MRPFISFILILVFVAATFCLPLAAMAADPLVFGLTLGLTGKYEKASAIQEQGYQLWVRDVNQRGGILGRPVQLKLFDDQSDPQVAIGHYRQFAEQDRVDFLLAPFSSDITEAILPIAREHGYSIIAAGAAADRLWQQGYTNVFGLFTPASRIPASFLEMAVMHDLQTMAVVYCDDPFGRDIGTGTVKWSRRFGLTTVLEQKVGKNSLDFDQLAATIKAARPDIVVVGGHLYEAVLLRLALKRVGYRPRAFYTPVGLGMQAFRNTLQRDSDLVFSSSQWVYQGGFHGPGTLEFVQAFQEIYGREPAYFAATAYAAGQIMEKAISKAKSVNRERINRILFSLDTMSVIGRFGVDRTGKQIKNFTLVTQARNGTIEVVWPQSLKTAEPVFE